MLDVPLCAGVGANCAVTLSPSRSAENVPGWKYRWNLTEYWITRPIGSAGCVIQHALQPWISDTSGFRSTEGWAEGNADRSAPVMAKGSLPGNSTELQSAPTLQRETRGVGRLRYLSSMRRRSSCA